ncbi:MAG: hypothetical protein NZ827_07360 [Aquificaceae bacterium]|nr:hypothetical protein [Aquificaceae bacterium]
MRFFISADIKKNRALFYAVIFFMVFSFLFWVASFLHFYSKYGFSQESLRSYFFVDPQLGERVSIAQISEDFHVGVFLQGMVLLMLFSLLNLTHWSQKLKLSLIISTSLFALFYLSSDFLVILIGPSSAFLKILGFLLYQVTFLLVWLLTFYSLLSGKNSRAPKPQSLKLLVLVFSLFSLFFLLSNFLNFHTKMGFGVQGIRDYFLGNPELFIKRKSFEGFFKVFYPHLVAMSIYAFALAHLLPFGGTNRSKTLFLGFSLFSLSFFDNLSGLLLLYLSPNFAYLKLFSFWGFQLLALSCSLLLLTASLRKENYPSLYL